MEDSLQPTLYCNHGHPDLQAVAASLKAGEHDPVAIARRTFHFVRDGIAFGFDLFQRQASDTLKRGYGSCWNKALLLAALLRGNRIPARFGSIPVKRSFVKPAIGAWYLLLNNPYNHCLVQAHLNQRWTILDPALDLRTYEALYLPLGVAWGIDWNGQDDVRLYSESVLGSPVFYQDIDAALNGKVGNTELPTPLAGLVNLHLSRQMWRRTGAFNPKEVMAGPAAGKGHSALETGP